METTLVTNDILMKIYTQEIMLDLSAAFDTVNHNILLTRLNEEFGIYGVALEWFKSEDSESSSTNPSQSALVWVMDCGVL